MPVEVVIPMLGVTVEKGKIVDWLKKEGDPVEKGESIFIVEADKVTTEVESPASGVLAKILLLAGVEVPVLTVVGLITEPGEELSHDYIPSSEQVTVDEVPKVAQEVAASVSAMRDSGETIRIAPAARKLARDKGLDITALSAIGTGPDGIILFSDIEEMIARQSSPAIRASSLARQKAEGAGVPVGSIEGSGVRGRVMQDDVDRSIEEAAKPRLGKVIPMDSMRRTIANRLSASASTVPQVSFYTDISMDPLLNFREEINPEFEKRFGLRLSINDFLIKAVALNILDFPMLNATLKEDNIHILPEVNIGLAVSLPTGLIVPAIANADTAELSDIARQRSDLVKRALSGQLIADEIGRGTFTVSSLARYDVTFFTSILNLPQSGILSVAKTREELTLVDGEVKVKKVATVGIACDHRIIDGVMAVEFLQCLKRKLEKPVSTFSC